ncbi:MAG: hypothetical protein ACJ780_25945 [Solirubrobacteraceae bacterium]
MTGTAGDLARRQLATMIRLVAMTMLALLFLPVVLLYQGRSFHVFRWRVGAPPA